MLSPICTSRRSILACVKFRSRVLTALNFAAGSIATLALAEQFKAPAQHHELTADPARMASPLSLRKSAIVLKLASGDKSATPTRCCAGTGLQAPARLHAIEVSVDVNLQQRRRMIGRPSPSPPARRRQSQVWPDQAHRQRHRSPGPDYPLPNIHPTARENSVRAWTAVIANHKTRHPILRPNRWRIVSSTQFSHSLGPKPDMKARQRLIFQSCVPPCYALVHTDYMAPLVIFRSAYKSQCTLLDAFMMPPKVIWFQCRSASNV